MTLLDKPWKVDRDGERLYAYVSGEVCIDIVSGTPEDRRRVLAFLVQAQAMAALLRRVDASAGFEATSTAFHAEVRSVLRDAGVSDVDGMKRGT